MLLWWDGLTMIEKRIPSNKDMLIRTAEIAFLSQATAGTSLSGSTSTNTTKSDTQNSGEKSKSNNKEDNQKNKD